MLMKNGESWELGYPSWRWVKRIFFKKREFFLIYCARFSKFEDLNDRKRKFISEENY